MYEGLNTGMNCCLFAYQLSTPPNDSHHMHDKNRFLSDHNEERGKVSNDYRGAERPGRGGL